MATDLHDLIVAPDATILDAMRVIELIRLGGGDDLWPWAEAARRRYRR